ncbi:hypothetical protein CEE36_00735 [candidate division TA06 bacterium B3_TA06]|uniref:Peptidase S8/S53 domain-containing protein n=1 Tax=candidate division TA06 bacterium B3_TA06 TaxID=2012487 RepID=A0A532VAS0_UNCT6|nr:MAG: hypothetical protein CEE36_00735 [candidate division TA06 bacterium B3_TA06]
MRHSIVLRIVVGAVILALLIPLGISAAEDAIETNEFIIKAPDSEALQAFVEENGLSVGPLITYPNPSEEVLELFGCYYIVTFPEELQEVQDSLVEELEGLEGVEYVDSIPTREVEPDIEEETESYFFMPDSFSEPYTPNDPLYNQQWNMRITKTNWAWNVSTADGVKVGIIDTGIDTDHEDLVDNINFEFSYNFYNNNINIEDGNGHGTHVSGIAGAKIDNNKGIAGVAGNCLIIPLRVSNNSGAIKTSWVINAVYYAADNNIPIINISLGSYNFSEEYKTATDYAWENGVFLCAVAGNENTNDKLYPAAYEHVMSIGATTSSDSRWSKSNYGSSVDIYAPGANVLTTEEDGTYATHSGTSDATPHVAGLAALIWDVHPDWINQQIWDRILNSADTIQIDKGKVLRMNSMRALGIDSVSIAEPVTPVTPVTHLSSWQITSSVGRQITLRYSDYPQGFSASVFDATGRKVDELHSDQPSGTIEWGECYGPGVYFIRDAESSTTQKAVLVR